MQTRACPELCPDYPLGQFVPSEKRELELSDNFIPEGTVNPVDKSISFDFEYGRPVGPHLVEVGLVPEGGGEGIGFWVDSSVGLSGMVRVIENCGGPKGKRSGFLRLRKESVCGAILKVAKEV